MCFHHDSCRRKMRTAYDTYFTETHDLLNWEKTATRTIRLHSVHFAFIIPRYKMLQPKCRFLYTIIRTKQTIYNWFPESNTLIQCILNIFCRYTYCNINRQICKFIYVCMYVCIYIYIYI